MAKVGISSPASVAYTYVGRAGFSSIVCVSILIRFGSAKYCVSIWYLVPKIKVLFRVIFLVDMFILSKKKFAVLQGCACQMLLLCIFSLHLYTAYGHVHQMQLCFTHQIVFVSFFRNIIAKKSSRVLFYMMSCIKFTKFNQMKDI